MTDKEAAERAVFWASWVRLPDGFQEIDYKALAYFKARLSALPSIPEGKSEPPAYQERRVWIPEAPKFPGTYATAHPEQGENCTRVISKARQFKTREECAAWCAANPEPAFEPHEHVFVTLPPPTIVPCKADIEHLINGIKEGKGDNPVWDGGWETGVDAVLRMFDIRIWDNFHQIDERELDKLHTLILTPPVVKNTTNVAESTTPKKVSRADIREWVRAMANVVDEHRDILQDRYLMMCEANENYLRDKLCELGCEVEEEKT